MRGLSFLERAGFDRQFLLSNSSAETSALPYKVAGLASEFLPTFHISCSKRFVAVTDKSDMDEE